LVLPILGAALLVSPPNAIFFFLWRKEGGKTSLGKDRDLGAGSAAVDVSEVSSVFSQLLGGFFPDHGGGSEESLSCLCFVSSSCKQM